MTLIPPIKSPHPPSSHRLLHLLLLLIGGSISSTRSSLTAAGSTGSLRATIARRALYAGNDGDITQSSSYNTPQLSSSPEKEEQDTEWGFGEDDEMTMTVEQHNGNSIETEQEYDSNTVQNSEFKDGSSEVRMPVEEEEELGRLGSFQPPQDTPQIKYKPTMIGGHPIMPVSNSGGVAPPKASNPMMTGGGGVMSPNDMSQTWNLQTSKPHMVPYDKIPPTSDEEEEVWGFGEDEEMTMTVNEHDAFGTKVEPGESSEWKGGFDDGSLEERMPVPVPKDSQPNDVSTTPEDKNWDTSSYSEGEYIKTGKGGYIKKPSDESGSTSSSSQWDNNESQSAQESNMSQQQMDYSMQKVDEILVGFDPDTQEQKGEENDDGINEEEDDGTDDDSEGGMLNDDDDDDVDGDDNDNDETDDSKMIYDNVTAVENVTDTNDDINEGEDDGTDDDSEGGTTNEGDDNETDDSEVVYNNVTAVENVTDTNTTLFDSDNATDNNTTNTNDISLAENNDNNDIFVEGNDDDMPFMTPEEQEQLNANFIKEIDAIFDFLPPQESYSADEVEENHETEDLDGDYDTNENDDDISTNYGDDGVTDAMDDDATSNVTDDSILNDTDDSIFNETDDDAVTNGTYDDTIFNTTDDAAIFNATNDVNVTNTTLISNYTNTTTDDDDITIPPVNIPPSFLGFNAPSLPHLVKTPSATPSLSPTLPFLYSNDITNETDIFLNETNTTDYFYGNGTNFAPTTTTTVVSMAPSLPTNQSWNVTLTPSLSPMASYYNWAPSNDYDNDDGSSGDDGGMEKEVELIDDSVFDKSGDDAEGYDTEGGDSEGDDSEGDDTEGDDDDSKNNYEPTASPSLFDDKFFNIPYDSTTHDTNTTDDYLFDDNVDDENNNEDDTDGDENNNDISLPGNDHYYRPPTPPTPSPQLISIVAPTPLLGYKGQWTLETAATGTTHYRTKLTLPEDTPVIFTIEETPYSAVLQKYSLTVTVTNVFSTNFWILGRDGDDEYDMVRVSSVKTYVSGLASSQEVEEVEELLKGLDRVQKMKVLENVLYMVGEEVELICTRAEEEEDEN